MTELGMSILSTSPANSPQHVSARQQCTGAELYPAQLFPPTMPQMHGGAAGQKQKDNRHSKQRNQQGRGTTKAQQQQQHQQQQPQQASRNFLKNNEITHQPPPWTDVTTVMMRNLPNKYTQHMLLSELQMNKFQLQHEFDFFYLPMDHYSAVNLGYCFINFVDPRVANAFAAAFQGRRMRHFNSQKTIVVMPASMQGFEKNYAYYSSTRVAQAEDPQYRPIFTRPPTLCPAIPQFAPCTTVVWTQPDAGYGGWMMPCAQAPYVSAAMPQGFAGDAEAELERRAPMLERQYSDGSLEVYPSYNQGDHREAAVEQVEDVHMGDSGHSRSRLLIRNTFLAVPERSPSVERCLQRQCKSCPVSAPQSATGSARIEFCANKPSGLDFAVVAAASCLAMDLGCVAVQDSHDSTGSGSLSSGAIRSSAGSTTAESEREANAPIQQMSGSFEDVSSDMSGADFDNFVLGSPQFPCKGSALHKIGTCKPCAFHCQGGAAACKNGIECSFCHLCEPGEKKRRKKEKQAMKRELREKIRQKRAAVPQW